ncbi:NAD(P)/FAD-dependent oxidoreductase [Leptolyngbya cf. ectocarpi LEGE 11479]|uniref:NAD(P)/FAD-dependent oxidoreductase n=1 Tax=Leptolyngbya cf. ectocarpi LEGE 11479 TaxID=1828722 RepID=A0A928X176_LEPEC|nr:FAD-dependent oxidoreductase [Leptolyngbya ectocarpi]MBE9065946.1 NAD(P)/FAD-dependent oxidoreductase [Leptolyngbya cf. ectocarpi LEGE 11479]
MANYSTDYDLAILGGSISSRLAACAAAQKGARVALIEPNWQVNDTVWYTWQALCHLESAHLESASNRKVVWSRLCEQWDYQREHGDYTALSPAVLRSQGIDVIREPTRFTPEQCLTLEHRQLKASRYLLTDGYGPGIPTSVVSSLGSKSRLYCHQLMELKDIPEQIAVVGQGATAVEWAYALSWVAYVTLISPSKRLLPAEDQDIQRLSEAQLRSLGIKILISDSLASDSFAGDRDTENQTARIKDEQWVFTPPVYGWENLGLEQLDVLPGVPIAVNQHLQTRCSAIYASGSSLGGENRPELTRQETAIALGNTLFGRRSSMHYERAFYSIHMLSPIGRWGLTERQARERYGHRVKIFQSCCLPVHADHVAQTNFCKLVTVEARIIGVHLMGKEAPALVTTLGNSPTMQAISQWEMAGSQPGTLFNAVSQSIAQWKSNRWNEGQWRRDWADNWFNIRRSM